MNKLLLLIATLALAGGAFWAGRTVGESDLYARVDDATVGAVIYNLKAAYHLREAKPELLLSESEQALGGHVRYLQAMEQPNAQARYLLWKIKRYYSDFKVTPPAELAPLLARIPDDRPNYSGRIGETPEYAPTP